MAEGLTSIEEAVCEEAEVGRAFIDESVVDMVLRLSEASLREGKNYIDVAVRHG